MPIVISCPSCARSLKVPDHILGQQVKCPVCSTQFLAAEQASEIPVVPVAAEPEPPAWSEPPAAPWSEPPLPSTWSTPSRYDANPVQDSAPPSRSELRGRVQGRVLPPAICSMVVGCIGLLLYGLALCNVVLSALMANRNPDMVAITFVSVLVGIGLLISSLVVSGAYNMIKLQSHRAAMTGSIAGVVPCFCLGLGIPFGIWSIIILNDPEVRSAFWSNRPRASDSASFPE